MSKLLLIVRSNLNNAVESTKDLIFSKANSPNSAKANPTNVAIIDGQNCDQSTDELEHSHTILIPNHFPNITKREKFCEFLPF